MDDRNVIIFLKASEMAEERNERKSYCKEEENMLAESLHGNNRLIRKTILRMYPASFASTLTVSIALMMDTLLAGAVLGQQAIAAVAIGLPAIGIFQALTQTIINGAGIKMAVYAGRSDREKLQQTYSLGFAGTVALGLFFIAVCQVLAPQLTRIFGGAKAPEAAAQAGIYLRAGSVCILMGSLNTYLGKILALFGYQKAVFRSAMIAVLGNVVFSLLLMRLLPDGMAIAGLGIGTWCGGLLAVLSSWIEFRRRRIPLRFRIKDVHICELPGIARLGISSSGNMLADNVVAGLLNNIIVAGFGGNTLPLSIYTAVKGIFSFAITAITGVTVAASPLLGILYGSRDRNGLLRTVKEGCKVGLAVSVIWCGILAAALPVLKGFYGMQNEPEFISGVLICMLFIPLHIVMRIFVQVFESTEKTGMGMLYAIVPDSVIYPLLLVALMPKLGYYGIWLSYAGNAIVFLLILYLLRSVACRDFRLNMDRMLCLDQSIRDHVPMLDISVTSNHTDVTGISRQVHEFLEKQGTSPKTAYVTALCLEELAADFVAHTSLRGEQAAERTIMDIKLFSDEDFLRIIMRNAADAYNPLDFELNDETFSKVGVRMVQKLARHIDYNYVYKLNIVTIDVNK